jgi:crotonobetainyl-CoA:carnitine CoA-transferase CaiB-like acyl-CoA transferase
MIGEADVFIQNLAPGVMARLGFDVHDLRRRYPRLITCSISGYGEDGPFAHLKAYDLLVQAETGLASLTGNAHGAARVGVSVCDIAAGMTALSSILQALYARERTGAGRHISLSLFHALADWMNVPYLQYVYGGVTPTRSGLSHPSIAPYGVFRCADGKEILISIQNEREWADLCAEVLGQGEIAVDPRFSSNEARVRNRAETEAVVQGVFGRYPQGIMIERLEKARIAYGRLSTLEDLRNHAQARTVTVETPAGQVTMLAPGFIMDGVAPAPGPVPRLGEHTDRVLAEFSARRVAAET